jgi:hypothetical protein
MAGDEELNSQAVNNSTTASTYDARVLDMDNALKRAKGAFERNGNSLFTQTVFLGSICFVLVLMGIVISIELCMTSFPDEWSWQIIYYTAIRITLFSAYLTLSAYCFKMLSSHVHLYQKNRHKRAIVDSMASLVETGGSQSRDTIHKTLTDMIIHYGNIGIIGKETDSSIDRRFEEIKTMIEKISKPKD